MTDIPAYIPPHRRVVSPVPATTPVAEIHPIQQPQYISVFDDPSRFEHCFRMAEILANSLFVPGGSSQRPNESFRGNPANCLIALDLAGRLGLTPTSLFPHLYVINGRPALSAQFVIALVNRSGRFSRIAWDEGEDGEVLYERNGRPCAIPNYWAEAYFTELATGIEYRSTRVSLELAKRSGWLSKNESKWQSLPQEMCRWRSASWLAKNYAPELILGLECEDEVRDYDAQPVYDSPTRSVPVLASSHVDAIEQESVSDVDELLDAIKKAKTVSELTAIANEIGTRDNINGADKQALRDAFKRRRNELASNVPAQAETESKAETTPKRTRKAPTKKTAETQAEPEPKAETTPKERQSTLLETIRSVETLVDLANVVEAIKTTSRVGEMNDAQYRELMDAVDIKQNELLSQDYEDEAEPAPTQLQLKNEEIIRDALTKAKGIERVKAIGESVTDAVNNGDLTKAQGAELYRAVEEVSNGFLL